VSDGHGAAQAQRGYCLGHRSQHRGQKKLIEDAYRLSEHLGLSVWCTDPAGPFQTVPYPGVSWQPEGKLACQPHEYLRNGTAKILTLLHPADGQVRVSGITSCTNPMLHGWLKQELSQIVAALPPSLTDAVADEEALRSCWERWQVGLTIKPTLAQPLPPLRILLILDNLAGHSTPEFVLWLFAYGIMPLYTPLGGSWLNMAESLQCILKRRALNGQHPTDTDQMIARFLAVAAHWNQAPTPFEWGGKRQERWRRQRSWRHRVGGSGAYTRKPLARRLTPAYVDVQRK
jgi:hypothetical protein